MPGSECQALIAQYNCKDGRFKSSKLRSEQRGYEMRVAVSLTAEMHKR